MDKDLREKTIEEFLPVIKHLAYKMARGFENDNLIDDLISAGIIGLLEVMEKYDASQGGEAQHLRLPAHQGGHDRRAAVQGLVPQERQGQGEEDPGGHEEAGARDGQVPGRGGGGRRR